MKLLPKELGPNNIRVMCYISYGDTITITTNIQVSAKVTSLVVTKPETGIITGVKKYQKPAGKILQGGNGTYRVLFGEKAMLLNVEYYVPILILDANQQQHKFFKKVKDVFDITESFEISLEQKGRKNWMQSIEDALRQRLTHATLFVTYENGESKLSPNILEQVFDEVVTYKQ